MQTSYRIEERGADLRVIVPIEKNGKLIILMLCMLAGAVYFAVPYARDLYPAGNSAAFIKDLIAMTFLAGLGCLSIAILLLELFGAEVIDLTAGELRIRRTILGMGGARRYKLAKISRLRLDVPDTAKIFGKLAFEYAGKSVHFAGDISVAEAMQLLETLHGRFPSTKL